MLLRVLVIFAPRQFSFGTLDDEDSVWLYDKDVDDTTRRALEAEEASLRKLIKRVFLSRMTWKWALRVGKKMLD